MKAGEEEPAAAVDAVEKIEETPAELQKTEPTQAEADDNKARNGQVDLLLRRSPDPAALADLEPNQIKPILTVNSQLKSTIDWYNKVNRMELWSSFSTVSLKAVRRHLPQLLGVSRFSGAACTPKPMGNLCNCQSDEISSSGKGMKGVKPIVFHDPWTPAAENVGLNPALIRICYRTLQIYSEPNRESKVLDFDAPLGSFWVPTAGSSCPLTCPRTVVPSVRCSRWFPRLSVDCL